jgi:hypothetical protein
MWTMLRMKLAAAGDLASGWMLAFVIAILFALTTIGKRMERKKAKKQTPVKRNKVEEPPVETYQLDLVCPNCREYVSTLQIPKGTPIERYLGELDKHTECPHCLCIISWGSGGGW